MDCRNCKFGNPKGAQFCIQCGLPLSLKCIQCNADNLPVARFCQGCGKSLDASRNSESSIQRPHDARVFDRTQDQTESVNLSEGERKTITALFADLRGSTELIQKLDPEEARAVIDPVLKSMMDCVDGFGGHVVQSTGDGIFALFGAPLAYEDHPQRAILAALEIQKKIGQLRLHPERRAVKQVEARVGLDTGEVVLREIETSGGAEYTPIGLAANLASRIQGLALPGSVLITERLRKLTEGYFQFEDLGPKSIKGLTESITVHQVTGLGPLRTRFQAAVQRGLSAFVGRDNEIRQLQSALELAKNGRGQVVTVVGAPGVGKSRLFFEFKKLQQHSPTVVLEALAISHGKAHAYLPVVELLKSYFHIEDRDNDETRRQKIRQQVSTLDQKLELILPFLFGLLATTEGSSSDEALRGEAGRRRLRDAIKRLVLRESVRQPVIVIFEDLQWIDTETKTFLDLLVDSVASASILLLFNCRPEYRDEWGGKSYYSRLRLDPLDDSNVGELLDVLLHDTSGFTALKRLVVEQSEGNPLFIEEIIQTMFDLGLIDRNGSVKMEDRLAQIHIPSTVQGVLASRIDRLPAAEKSLLQTLAVIGKSFSLSLIKRVVQLTDDRLELLLSKLQLHEFIYEEPGHSDPVYSLKHSFTLEVAYNSLLVERRKLLHEQIAAAIESLFSGRLEDHLMELAQHYKRGANVQKAVDYFQREAVRINGIGLGHQSVEIGLEAISLLGVDLPTNPDAIVARIGEEAASIRQLLADRKPTDLLMLPAAEPESAPLIGALLLIGPFAFQSLQPELFALMAHIALRLTLEHGNGPLAPDVYSMYSVVYGAQTRDRLNAYAYSRLALDLDARNGSPLMGRVGFVHTWFHNHWVKPLNTSLEITMASAEAGFRANDVTFGCYNLAADITYRAAAGVHLVEIIDTARAHLNRIKGRIMETTFICILEMQMAKALAGMTVQRLALTDEEYDETRDLASIVATDQANQIAQYFSARLKLHYWFGDAPGALSWQEKVVPMSQAYAGEIMEFEVNFFHALALLEVARNAAQDVKPSLLHAARDNLDLLTGWARICPANFRHKALLVEAELGAVQGSPLAELFHESAQAAEKEGLIQYQALAYERLGSWLHGRNEFDAARGALVSACHLYSKWGARAKEKDINSRYLAGIGSQFT
jgi:predicted ATPase/class 3 adenylate cyclase